jgi:hypothetical protein
MLILAKNQPTMLSAAAKSAAFVLLMLLRTTDLQILENSYPILCKYGKSGYFLKLAAGSNK